MKKTNKILRNTWHQKVWLSQMIISGLLLCTLVIGVSTAWSGGRGHGHKHAPKAKVERMTKSLNLTQEQQDKILAILQEKHEKLEALHNQMKEVRQGAWAKVEAQLNPEQLEKFRKAKEKRKKKRQEYKEKHEKGKGHGKMKHGKDDHHD